MEPRKIPAIHGSSGSYYNLASSFEEITRAKEKIEVLPAAAAHPPPPPSSLHREKHPHHGLGGVTGRLGGGGEGQSRAA